tara:strand:- start:387 stop:593 length:207 start_codon:yes stop_codon:yes gene_type:complete
MKELNLNQMEAIEGNGDFMNGFCAGMTIVSAGAIIAAATNWWNPIGWAGGVLLAADIACGAYGISQLN